jgi:hypothetical protein
VLPAKPAEWRRASNRAARKSLTFVGQDVADWG